MEEGKALRSDGINKIQQNMRDKKHKTNIRDGGQIARKTAQLMVEGKKAG